VYSYHRSFQDHSPFEGKARKLDLGRQAYFAGNVGCYPNLNDQPFPIESANLAKKYGATLDETNRCLVKVDRLLTKQLPYAKNVRGKGRTYNMRRINQLIKHTWWKADWDLNFLFDYDFMSSFLYCYKMNRLLDCSVNNPEVRLLLTYFNACSSVVDKHPGNFAFELSSRLAPIADVLPKRTYNLLQQCLKNCALHMLNSKSSYVLKYVVGTVCAIRVTFSKVLVLVKGKLLIFDCPDNKWLTAKHAEYELPSTDLTGMECSSLFVCLYSPRSLLVFEWDMHHFERVMQLNVEEPVHVAIVNGNYMIICSKKSQLIEIWNCHAKTLIESFSFNAPLLQCSTVIFSRQIMRNTVMTEVILENGEIYYLKLIETTDPDSDKDRFKLCRSPNEKPGKRSVIWKFGTAVYYDKRQSHVHFYECLPDSITNNFGKIDNLPTLTNLVCVSFSKVFGSALIWFTNDCAAILHSCGKHFTIPGEYHEVCPESISINSVRNIVCFLNRNELKYSLFQLKCGEGVHQYCYLGHLQLDQKICHYAWRSGEFC
jgi:hypothetical protein